MKIHSLWPFVHKKTAYRIMKVESDRVMFRRFADLFADLSPIELKKDRTITAAGFALLDESGSPVSIVKFGRVRVLMPGHKFQITKGLNWNLTLPAKDDGEAWNQ